MAHIQTVSVNLLTYLLVNMNYYKLLILLNAYTVPRDAHITLHEVGIIIIAVLQIRTLRLRV